MKKHLQQNEEAGFYLIYTIWLTMFIFIALTTSLILYQYRLMETDTLMELTKKETLVQMAKESFQQDGLHHSSEDGLVRYSYPNGEVEVEFEKRKDGHWRLNMAITTRKGHSYIGYYLVPTYPN